MTQGDLKAGVTEVAIAGSTWHIDRSRLNDRACGRCSERGTATLGSEDVCPGCLMAQAVSGHQGSEAIAIAQGALERLGLIFVMPSDLTSGALAITAPDGWVFGKRYRGHAVRAVIVPAENLLAGATDPMLVSVPWLPTGYADALVLRFWVSDPNVYPGPEVGWRWEPPDGWGPGTSRNVWAGPHQRDVEAKLLRLGPSESGRGRKTNTGRFRSKAEFEAEQDTVLQKFERDGRRLKNVEMLADEMAIGRTLLFACWNQWPDLRQSF